MVIISIYTILGAGSAGGVVDLQQGVMSHRLTGTLKSAILHSLLHETGVQMLTSAHCEQINSAIYTHEYTIDESTDYTSDYTGQFEADTGFENGVDIGGMIVYMRDRELLAFFDYELAAGAVFKMPFMA